MNEEYLLKICLIGKTKLKTKVARRFAIGKFETNYLPTLGVDISTKKLQIDDTKVKLILVNTAKQEFFGKLRPSYYRGASAAIIFYETGDNTSFQAVPDYLAEFRNNNPYPTIPLALIGIKTTVSKKQDKLTREKSARKQKINLQNLQEHKWKGMREYVRIKLFRKIRTLHDAITERSLRKNIENTKEITHEQGQKLAKKYDMSFSEIDLEDDDQITRIIIELCHKSIRIR